MGMPNDKGLYMPEYIPDLSSIFRQKNILTFQEVSLLIASKFIGKELSNNQIQNIIETTLQISDYIAYVLLGLVIIYFINFVNKILIFIKIKIIKEKTTDFIYQWFLFCTFNYIYIFFHYLFPLRG